MPECPGSPRVFESDEGEWRSSPQRYSYIVDPVADVAAAVAEKNKAIAEKNEAIANMQHALLERDRAIADAARLRAAIDPEEDNNGKRAPAASIHMPPKATAATKKSRAVKAVKAAKSAAPRPDGPAERRPLRRSSRR